MIWHYAVAQNKTIEKLEQMLTTVFVNYGEYHDEGFDSMVELFATDDFYNLHYVAKRYLKLKEENQCLL